MWLCGGRGGGFGFSFTIDYCEKVLVETNATKYFFFYFLSIERVDRQESEVSQVLNAEILFVISLQSKNKVSLRNLSMVLRQLSGPPVEKIKLIEESVERAKEAVQLDITDGTSWCRFSVY